MKKVLILLLSMTLVISMIPVSFAGSTSNMQENSAECVMYNLLDMPVYVSSDAEMAQDAPEQYKLFDDDGNYTIELEDNAFFPYEVLFAYQSSSDGEWVKTREWFDTPKSTVEVAGHTFSVHSEMNDTDKISQFGVYVGDDYVAARPVEKEFSDNGGISLTSLQPLKEVKLELDLSEYLPPELIEVKPDVIFADNPDIDVKESDKVVWGKWYGWNNYENDEFNIIDGYFDFLDLTYSYNENFTLEMIVGNADQLDNKNIRYIINFTVTPEDEWLQYDLLMSDGSSADNNIEKKNQKIEYYYGDNVGLFTRKMASIDVDKIEGTSLSGRYKIAFHFPNGKFADRKSHIKIYADYLDSEAEPKDITDEIFGKYREFEPAHYDKEYDEDGNITYSSYIIPRYIIKIDGKEYCAIYPEYKTRNDEITFDGLYDRDGNEAFNTQKTICINNGIENIYVYDEKEYKRVISQSITYGPMSRFSAN